MRGRKADTDRSPAWCCALGERRTSEKPRSRPSETRSTAPVAEITRRTHPRCRPGSLETGLGLGMSFHVGVGLALLALAARRPLRARRPARVRPPIPPRSGQDRLAPDDDALRTRSHAWPTSRQLSHRPSEARERSRGASRCADDRVPSRRAAERYVTLRAYTEVDRVGSLVRCSSP
jgi:hypothetical protein